MRSCNSALPLQPRRSLSLALCGWAWGGSGVGRFDGAGGWWWAQRDPRRIVRRSRQPAPVRLDGVLGAGGVHFSPHKSGSSLALRTPPRPVVAGARSSQAAPPARAPRAFHHRPRPAPSFAKAPRPGLRRRAVAPRPRPPRCGCSRTTSASAFVASAPVSRSFLAVAAAPLLSRHPPP